MNFLLTPTPYPSPQGGGELGYARARRTLSRTALGNKVPLPLVGRGKGWGYHAATAKLLTSSNQGSVS
ncbi:hypothetical protein L611_004400000160 [Aminobacter sp. J15]|nr:hypothetical protein L610_004600000050 [Aminobacter sp. J44]TWH28221.1 hypothetical protein L611_004400000160 [Aminobacter sp. J15]